VAAWQERSWEASNDQEEKGRGEAGNPTASDYREIGTMRMQEVVTIAVKM
jgi:hypothetical protein